MTKREIYIVLITVLVAAFVSSAVSYLVVKNQSNIRFVPAPREDNPDYGYLEINGKKYYQLYTTTQVDLGNGLHYHRIDLRGSIPLEPNEEDLQNQREINRQ